MTQTLGFAWTYSDDTHYVITELFADGTSRTVSPQYALYMTWIQSNTPSQIAGNQYVTFPGGVPTYNTAQAQADATAAAWVQVRSHRNLLIAQCDWVVLNDGPIFPNAVLLSQWKTYRQALRDITKQTDPTMITWPTPPSTVEPSPI